MIAAPAEAFVYTPENIHTSYQESPDSFTVNEFGETYGVTVGGNVFTQTNVANVANIRLQRFAIGTAFWYVSDRGVIWAETDLHALSIYLSLT